MRFDVPQFIEVEDKIFGPFTWKQFIYLAGGVGAGAVLFLIAPFIVFVIIGAPLIGLAVLLAFYPVNNRPFEHYLESMVTYFSRTRNYRWQKATPNVYREEDSSDTVEELLADYSHMPVSRPSGDLNNLARKLELNTIDPSDKM